MELRTASASLDELLMPVTWEEYLRLENPPGLRFEYEEGRLIVSPTGRNAHSLFIGELWFDLKAYEKSTGGKYCLVFSQHSFFMPPGERDYQPDIGVVTDERKAQPLDPDGWMTGAPNIAVEVLSPSTQTRDRGIKARRYFEQVAAEYWLFDAEAEAASFYRRGERDWVEVPLTSARYETPLLPGFVLDIADLWRRLRRLLKGPASKK